MSTWSSLLIKQKTYEITKLLPETEYTVSINGIYNEPIEVWLTALIKDENGIVGTDVNQTNAVYVGNLEYNKLTFTAQESHTALVIRPLGDLELTSIQLEKGTHVADWAPASEDFNPLKGIRYNLSQPLQKDQYYTLSLESEVDEFVGVWLGDDVHLGYLKDNKLTFKLTEQFNHDYIILKSPSENDTISKIKLEQDVTSTSYSPSPEDAYDLDLPHGAYHIQGGNSFSKIVTEGVHVGVNTYSWSNITLNGKPLPLETVDRYRENGGGLSFAGADLDFIASNPGIFGYMVDPYLEVTTEIVNEGNIYSKPMIRISYEGAQQKELRMTIGNTQMIYNWPTKEKEVEYDTSTGYSYHKGKRRDRHWHIDMAPFELPIGETKVVKETRYDTKVEVMEESRWR